MLLDIVARSSLASGATEPQLKPEGIENVADTFAVWYGFCCKSPRYSEPPVVRYISAAAQ